MPEWREIIGDLPATAVMGLIRGFEYGRQPRSLRGKDSQIASHNSNSAEQNPLEAYFDAHHEGAGLWKWRHYFDIYHRHFSKFRGRKVTVLEIGVFSGGSLGMWQHYFGPGCQIHGVDMLESCKTYESDSVRIHIGDQGDRDFWQRVRQEVPQVDIVIDDGSHMQEHQMLTLEELLPHVSPGGVYLCEDTYGATSQFHDFVCGITHWLSQLGELSPGVDDPHEGIATNPVQRDVKSVHHYPFVTVLEKHQDAMMSLAAPRKGTQWQPWDGG